MLPLAHSHRRPDTPLIRHQPTEGELADAVVLARAGSPTAVAELYGWFAPDLLRLTTRLLASREDAEDVVHDLFVGLPEHLARYDERGQLAAWLRATAIGVARMRLRRDYRRSVALARALTPDVSARTPDPHSSIDVERAVSALPESLRLVFVLKQWEGYSHEDIAQLLTISAGASRVRYSRALDALRRLLDP